MRSTGSARVARPTSKPASARGTGWPNESFDDGGINRVILASDGVANVGVTDPDQLARMIRDDADRGINLVTIGFGMGNFNDVTMEQLADQGDGFYAYVDTEDEAERLFEDELTSTLLTIAKDAKIQVEFDRGDRRGVPTDRLRESRRARPRLPQRRQSTPASSAPGTRSRRSTRSSCSAASTSTIVATSARCSCAGRTPTTAR